MSIIRLPDEVREVLERVERLEESLDAIRVGVDRLVELGEAKNG